MKWLFRILGVVLLLVVIVLVVAVNKVDGIVQEAVETIGPEYTQSEVALGGVNLSLLGGQLSLSELKVGNPAGFKTDSAFSLGEINVDLDLGSVRSDVIVIDSIRIVAPEVTYEKAGKTSNLQTLQRNIGQASGGSSSAPADVEGTEAAKKLIIKDLLVTDGKIHYSNPVLAGKTLDLALPEIHLTGIGEKSNGATASEVTKLLLTELNKHSMKAVANSDAVKDALGGLKGKVEEESGKLKGLLDNFRKKE